jgi:hypothetical protein
VERALVETERQAHCTITITAASVTCLFGTVLAHSKTVLHLVMP